jgi:mannosyltransferase OCH1-like enzyme
MGEATTPFVALARDGTDGQQTHADNSSQRRIPRVVWQTVRSRLGLSSSFNASWKLMVKANPGWTFNLVDNEDMERTVQSHAPTAALRAFQSINHAFGAARADFSGATSYCCLLGGCTLMRISA